MGDIGPVTISRTNRNAILQLGVGDPLILQALSNLCAMHGPIWAGWRQEQSAGTTSDQGAPWEKCLRELLHQLLVKMLFNFWFILFYSLLFSSCPFSSNCQSHLTKPYILGTFLTLTRNCSQG